MQENRKLNFLFQTNVFLFYGKLLMLVLLNKGPSHYVSTYRVSETNNQ